MCEFIGMRGGIGGKKFAPEGPGTAGAGPEDGPGDCAGTGEAAGVAVGFLLLLATLMYLLTTFFISCMHSSASSSGRFFWIHLAIDPISISTSSSSSLARMDDSSSFVISWS